jgi:hypothetical protein
MILGNKQVKIICDLNTTLIANTRDYRTAVHIITGHCGLNNHLYKMKKTNTSECPLCGHEDENVSHFLGQCPCPAIAQLRGQCFNHYYLSANDIFDNIHITSIIKYFNHTKRLLEPEALDTSGVIKITEPWPAKS